MSLNAHPRGIADAETKATRRFGLILVFGSSAAFLPTTMACAADDDEYNNPNMPAAPEERCTTWVCIVSNLAQLISFQKMASRTGSVESCRAQNMSLMIDNEIPRKNQKQARIRAANSMNTLQKISSTAASIEREMSPSDYDKIANLYRLLRVELNSLYELLSAKERNKYYGYFVEVTEYEKKIAEGVYNPDLDGVLKFDYEN
ncbi:hypothetical protein THAOC_35370 [Thalassiosira oceanica]|uniref:Uncharacterized protein n=1 Tax=Thalassiosira oceanica TaxID=159749 RepID=K0R110_THAOC|nr:hypothetical protein THAOC_35370 [Thalassiosira oceanica]|eukprot:EJK45988.1 hypothetical protein THAOC_35370 [Thalassiosira oceanica]